MRTETEIEDIYRRQFKTVYRVCFGFMKNAADTEDAVQETFYRLIDKDPRFENAEHEKAWLIRTASNVCRNELKSPRRRHEDIDEHTELPADEPEDADILRAVTELPEKYRTVIYLYYYEGCDSVQIAKMLKKPKSTVRNHLHEARKLLKERLGDIYEK